MKHFLKLADITSEQLLSLIDQAAELKADPCSSQYTNALAHKSLGLIFQKPSVRTRVSFDIGMKQLGGSTIELSQEQVGMGTREPVKDVARVLSRYVDIVMIRAMFHSDIKRFAEYSSVPVINGLCDLYHPCQAVADMLTIKEKKHGFDNLKLAYIGDGNNVCHSLIVACTMLGIEIVVACPKGHEPRVRFEDAKYSLTNDPQAAVESADIVYTDVWVSMGPQTEQLYQAENPFINFSVTPELMRQANSDAIFMHCLPAYRDEEVDAEVLESSQSVVFDQAENRMHAQKAILLSLLI